MSKKSPIEIIITIVISIVAFVGFSYLFALWTDRSLDFWLTYFKGVPSDVPFWLSWLASIALNVLCFAFNVLSEVLRVFLI